MIEDETRTAAEWKQYLAEKKQLAERAELQEQARLLQEKEERENTKLTLAQYIMREKKGYRVWVTEEELKASQIWSTAQKLIVAIGAFERAMGSIYGD